MGTNEERGLIGRLGSALGWIAGRGESFEAEALFALVGHLAKADGIITSYESEFANTLMDELRLSLRGREQALAAFNRGRDKRFDAGAQVAALLAKHPPGSPEAERVFDTLLRLAASDGRMYPRERQALEAIAAGFGIDTAALERRIAAAKA